MISATINAIGKRLGTKALIGVVVAAVVAIGWLAWQLRDARDDLHTAEQGLDQSIATIAAQQQEMAEYEAAVKAQRKREQAARERAAQAERRLQDLEASDDEVQDWSDAPIPRGVRDWLREPAGSDQAGHGDATE
jgi:LysB family phage lysis regulatory protein